MLFAISEWPDMKKAMADAVGKFWNRLRASFPSVRDIAIEDGAVSIGSAEALGYLAGGWFEEALFCELKRALPEAEIAMNVTTVLDDGSNHSDRSVREIDVVLALGDQLHAIEAKTGDFRKKAQTGGIDGTTVDRLIALRRLIGPRGTVALAASRHPDDDKSHGAIADLRQRASWDSIGFWIGRECRGELRPIVERLRPSTKAVSLE